MRVSIVGAGLSGCEIAYQLSKFSVDVDLYEMRPIHNTLAHKTDGLAELVCSNSLHSENLYTASGVLKAELALFDSLILKCAKKNRVPAGSALAVNRLNFSECVEMMLRDNQRVNIIRKYISSLNEVKWPVIIATGPLFEGPLLEEISSGCKEKTLYFFDAISPTIDGETIDYDRVFWKNRYDDSTYGDYLNIPLDKDMYDKFYEALIGAKTYPLKNFEKGCFFEGCLPIEIIAKRGKHALRFGPLRPVGLVDSKEYVAVIQLRREDIFNSAFNMVGFQTNLLFSEQKRIFRMLPGLSNAVFLRFGRMHRNTYFNSPVVLDNDMCFRHLNGVYLTGQLTGVEGYMESVTMGILLAYKIIAKMNMRGFIPPKTTAMGALYRHIRTKQANYQPMNINFGIFEPLKNPCKNKRERKKQYADRAILDMKTYLDAFLNSL